jgi:hypothetical protein
MTDEEFVKSRSDQAACFGPVTLYWPGQGERRKYIVTMSPVESRSQGEGDTIEEAWHNAAQRIRIQEGK